MNCYQALDENGKLLIVESILPELPGNSLPTMNTIQSDLFMLVQAPGGKERTENEFETLAKSAGFQHCSKVCCASGFWIMELYKQSFV